MEDIKQYADLGVTAVICITFIFGAVKVFCYWIDKKNKAPEQEENKLETRVALVEQNIGYIKDSYKEIKESIDGINKKLENHVVHISAKIDDLWETMNNLKNKQKSKK
jgi:hypothetical protein